MTDDQLRKIFGYQSPDASQAKSCVALRTSFFHLARLVLANSTPGRGQSLALTELQRASWAALAAVVDANEPDPRSLP